MLLAREISSSKHFEPILEKHPRGSSRNSGMQCTVMPGKDSACDIKVLGCAVCSEITGQMFELSFYIIIKFNLAQCFIFLRIYFKTWLNVSYFLHR